MSTDILATGPLGICLDASPLIHLNDAGVLDQFGNWFPAGSCFTAEVIVQLELAKSIDVYPQNQAIIDAPWLRAMHVQSEDFPLMSDLRLLWGSRHGRGEGEAEVLALCRRYGWTAVVNDGQARRAAKFHGIASVCTPALIVAAAAHGLISSGEGWELHCAVHEKLVPALILGIGKVFEPVYKQAVKYVTRWAKQNPPKEWPSLLAMPLRLDDVLKQLVAKEGLPPAVRLAPVPKQAATRSLGLSPT